MGQEQVLYVAITAFAVAAVIGGVVVAALMRPAKPEAAALPWVNDSVLEFVLAYPHIIAIATSPDPKHQEVARILDALERQIAEIVANAAAAELAKARS
mgnify:CR=1 FL=1